MNFKVATFFLLIITLKLTAQESKNEGKFKYIEIRSHYGGYFYSGNGLTDTGVLDNGYGAIDVKFGWQPSSEEHWASMYGYPSYGFGLYTGFLGDSQVFGNPNALYGFMNFNLSRRGKKNNFSIEPAFGITYNLNAFDPENNPLNDAIGASAAVYFSLDFSWAYPITREVDFKYGIDFVHFSNGRLYAPNYGLNMIGINLGFKYNYNTDQKKLDNDLYGTKVLQARFKRPISTPKIKLNENLISLYLAMGTSQNGEDAGTSNRHSAYSAVLEYQHLFNTMSGFSAGVDLFYDNSLKPNYPDPSDRYLIGIHAGYDLMFWKLAIRTQVGTYLTDSKGKGVYFMRPALQYKITKNLFAQVGLKTKGGSDWIEFGVGFKPFKW